MPRYQFRECLTCQARVNDEMARLNSHLGYMERWKALALSRPSDRCRELAVEVQRQRLALDQLCPGCHQGHTHGWHLRQLRMRVPIWTADDPSLVSYRRGVGYRRSPGDQPLPRSTLVGRCPTSLWSGVVVKLGRDRFRVRERCRMLMLSYYGCELRRIVR